MPETWKPNHLVVIGAGAMGSLFGGLLCEGGLNVTLLDIWQPHVDAINRNGLRLVGDLGNRRVAVRASTNPAEVGPADVVLVQCKAPHTAEALRRAASIISSGTVAISFQNGLGNEEVIGEAIGMSAVLGGLTPRAASVVEPGVVHAYSNLPSYVGELPGGISARVQRIANCFTAAGLGTIASENIVKDKWKKLMLNIGVSAFSAVTTLNVHGVVAVPELRELVLESVDEGLAVAKAAGIELDADEIRELLLKVIGPGGTSQNRSSLCVDILNKRRTEIDYINGAVVRHGQKYGVPTPINRALVAVVKGLESSFS